jgi:hypothetical protein
MDQKSLIERAIELAQSGAYHRIEHLERQLIAEGYSNVPAHLSGPTLRRQLRQRSSAARGEPVPKGRGRSPRAAVQSPSGARKTY